MLPEYIYLDNNATTPLDPRVLEEMMPYFKGLYGNSSSAHLLGKKIKAAVDRSRGEVGDLINSNPEDIVFTAGATEAVNIALRGLPKLGIQQGKHIITVSTEHPAVLDTCQYLENIGVAVTYLGVNQDGLIDLEELQQAITEETVLICVMLVNNETGVIQSIKQIAEIAHKHGILLMSDATQAVGKYPVDVLELGIDLLVFSAHKFYGPKGIGGLYINPRLKLNPLLYGGGQERGLRSGTLNVPGIIGTASAAKYAQKDMDKEAQVIGGLADKLKRSLLQIEDTFLNGSEKQRLYNTVNISFGGIDNEALLLNLQNICVSNGSACHSFTMEPSHVLLAMGLKKEEANSAIRFSLGRFNTVDEIDFAVEKVKESVKRLIGYCR